MLVMRPWRLCLVGLRDGGICFPSIPSRKTSLNSSFFQMLLCLMNTATLYLEVE